MQWPTIDKSATNRAESETYTLDVYLDGDRAVDVHVDGESLFPTWFKLEFKETGEISAKIKGLKLSTKRGDTIRVHVR